MSPIKKGKMKSSQGSAVMVESTFLVAALCSSGPMGLGGGINQTEFRLPRTEEETERQEQLKGAQKVMMMMMI